jgi:hypothetical protein
VGATEVDATEVGATEVGVMEVGATEAGATEVGATEVSATEVGDNEVGDNEVGATEVNFGIRIFSAPLIPILNTFSEPSNLPFIRHDNSSQKGFGIFFVYNHEKRCIQPLNRLLLGIFARLLDVVH